MIRICFVCLGNICRSPTAEGVFAKLAADAKISDSVSIDSAGTGAWHVGEPADKRSRAAALENGYTLTSKARKFGETDFENFDIILAMDRDNLQHLLALTTDEESLKKVRLFREFDETAETNAEVPDPYYGGVNGFVDVVRICERAGRGLLQHVQELLKQ